jgi:hypothetical protein
MQVISLSKLYLFRRYYESNRSTFFWDTRVYDFIHPSLVMDTMDLQQCLLKEKSITGHAIIFTSLGN